MKQLPLLVLAGGFGTRLQSLVTDVPKPLAPVHGSPFLAYLLKEWLELGVTSFIFLLHYKNEQIIRFVETFVNEEYKTTAEVDYIVEDKPLGTGGAISNALASMRYEGEFLVANADTWLETGVEKLIHTSSPALLTVFQQDTRRYGLLELEDNVVKGFYEKTDNNNSGWINAGAYRLHSDLFIQRPGTIYSLEEQILIPLAQAKQLQAIKTDSAFIDIGIPEDYLKFCAMVDAEYKDNNDET